MINDNSIDRTRPAKVGMKDVAKHAGVSISTVSLVFNEKPGISDEVRERVKAVAKTIGYEPKNRTTPHTNNYSIIFPYGIDDLMQRGGGNEIYDGYIDGFDLAAQDLNVDITYVPNVEHTMGEIFLRLLENEIAKSKGVIFCSLTRLDDPAFKFLKEQGIPMVLLNRMHDDPSISYVSVDYYKATYHMVTQLIEAGCRRIAYAGESVEREFLGKVKRNAYIAALKDNGMEIDEEFMCMADEAEEMRARIISCIERSQKPLGIYANANNTLQSIQEIATSLGVTLEKDLFLAGGEFLTTATVDYANANTVRYPYSEASYYALKAVDFMANNPTVNTMRLLLDWEYAPASEED